MCKVLWKRGLLTARSLQVFYLQKVKDNQFFDKFQNYSSWKCMWFKIESHNIYLFNSVSTKETHNKASNTFKKFFPEIASLFNTFLIAVIKPH